MNAVYLRPIFSCPSQTPHPSYAKNKGGGIKNGILRAFCDRDGCGHLHPVVRSAPLHQRNAAQIRAANQCDPCPTHGSGCGYRVGDPLPCRLPPTPEGSA